MADGVRVGIQMLAERRFYSHLTLVFDTFQSSLISRCDGVGVVGAMLIKLWAADSDNDTKGCGSCWRTKIFSELGLGLTARAIGLGLVARPVI